MATGRPGTSWTDQAGMDSEWRLSFGQIAAQLGIPERTVRCVIRQAAVSWGELEARDTAGDEKVR